MPLHEATPEATTIAQWAKSRSIYGSRDRERDDPFTYRQPMGECVFCGIVSGTRPHSIVCEDEQTVGFMSIRQQREGTSS